MISPNQKELIKDLRKEAHQVKECAVQYFIRSMIFVTAFLGSTIALMTYSENAALASVFVLPILYANTKILLHKYGAANRNLGYELHIERSQNFKELYNSKLSWEEEYGNIGWEEAMRAWRIVQATVFEAVCDKKYNKYKPIVEEIEYPWFDVKMLIDGGNEDVAASYYASSFLKNMISVIHIFMFLSLLPVILFSYNNIYNLFPLAVSLTVLIGASFYIWKIIKFTDGRRYQLESGILSISSCAIIWHAVILAHFRALNTRKELRNKKRKKENGYAYNVSIQATRLADNVGDIHSWIEGKWLRRSKRSTFTNPRIVHSTEPVEREFEIVDHSNGGVGAFVTDDTGLKNGDKISFKEDDVIAGEVAHISRADENGKYKVGIKSLASMVA